MLLWIAILFFAFSLLLIQNIIIDIRYWRENQQYRFTVVLRGPLGIPIYRSERATGKSAPTGGQKGFSIIKRLFPLANKQRPVLWGLIKRLRMRKLAWKTKFGTTEPAITGIGMGLVWVLYGWLLAFLQHLAWPVDPQQIRFVPVFTKSCFCTSFHCIVSIRIVHLITAQLKWFWLMLLQRKR